MLKKKNASLMQRIEWRCRTIIIDQMCFCTNQMFSPLQVCPSSTQSWKRKQWTSNDLWLQWQQRNVKMKEKINTKSQLNSMLCTTKHLVDIFDQERRKKTDFFKMLPFETSKSGDFLFCIQIRDFFSIRSIWYHFLFYWT